MGPKKIATNGFFLCLLWLIFSVGSATAVQLPQFDAATLKLSPPVPAGTPLAVNLGALRNGVATLTNVTLAECIQYAYDLPSNSLIAGPDWINSRDVRFDIVAKTSVDVPRDQVLLMMQNLLAERLQLNGLDVGRDVVARIECRLHCVRDKEILFFAQTLDVEVARLFLSVEPKFSGNFRQSN